MHKPVLRVRILHISFSPEPLATLSLYFGIFHLTRRCVCGRLLMPWCMTTDIFAPRVLSLPPPTWIIQFAAANTVWVRPRISFQSTRTKLTAGAEHQMCSVCQVLLELDEHCPLVLSFPSYAAYVVSLFAAAALAVFALFCSTSLSRAPSFQLSQAAPGSEHSFSLPRQGPLV